MLATDDPSCWTLRGSLATSKNEMKGFQLHVASIGQLFRRRPALFVDAGRKIYDIKWETGCRLRKRIFRSHVM
jgi:hypothetical protein